MTDNNDKVIGRLEGAFNEFLRHHESEKKQREEWRVEIKENLRQIDERLKPIESDHRFVMRVVKWGGGLVAFSAGLVKVWKEISDRLG